MYYVYNCAEIWHYTFYIGHDLVHLRAVFPSAYAELLLSDEVVVHDVGPAGLELLRVGVVALPRSHLAARVVAGGLHGGRHATKLC